MKLVYIIVLCSLKIKQPFQKSLFSNLPAQKLPSKTQPQNTNPHPKTKFILKKKISKKTQPQIVILKTIPKTRSSLKKISRTKKRPDFSLLYIYYS